MVSSIDDASSRDHHVSSEIMSRTSQKEGIFPEGGGPAGSGLDELDNIKMYLSGERCRPGR